MSGTFRDPDLAARGIGGGGLMDDLDRIETMAATYPLNGWVRRVVPPMVAELRAARKVVEAVRPFRKPLGVTYANFAALDEAVAAYDQAVTP